MPGVKTNEVAGTRAVLRHYRMSAYKAREVLDLIRGRDADRAEEILNATPREAARVVHKVLASAVANARNNEQLDPDDLYVSACYADEGTTLKRWRGGQRRGRAGVGGKGRSQPLEGRAPPDPGRGHEPCRPPARRRGGQVVGRPAPGVALGQARGSDPFPSQAVGPDDRAPASQPWRAPMTAAQGALPHAS